MTDKGIIITRKLAAYSLAALLALQVIDSLLQQPPWIIWVVRVVPLLIFVPGIRRDNLRSYIWLCFVCLLYFMVMVLRLFAEPTGVLPILGLASVVVLFISAMLYVRWRAQQLNKEMLNE